MSKTMTAEEKRDFKAGVKLHAAAFFFLLIAFAIIAYTLLITLKVIDPIIVSGVSPPLEVLLVIASGFSLLTTLATGVAIGYVKRSSFIWLFVINLVVFLSLAASTIFFVYYNYQTLAV